MDQQASIDYAKKYLEDLLSFFEVNSEVEVSVNDDVLELSVPASELSSILIGRNAETLRSLQYILSTTLRNDNADIQRVNLDIADYKKQRAEKLAEQAKGWIEQVQRTGDSYIANLNAADRRIVHGVAADYEDIQTFSEGEGRERHLIIAQKSS
ncbi:MAG: Single-stranded nucleic acid binding domain protein [Candidatus Saccharibacteria bacterium]|nr:Single-stranded nucleic acid binding domain protein [Candidatus Saccharibacteria bacterium]